MWHVKSWCLRNGIQEREPQIVRRPKGSLRPLVCARLPINDFPALVTAGRKAALRGDTWQFRERQPHHFRPATPVQTEAAYSPRRSLRFPRARAAVCWNNTSYNYLKGQREKSDASRE